ncbi:MAG: hypothetical protein M0C28_48830, partial [Candidatus Moduliflexus flocculans]|nr:hypothetical protein [Candidatus Moduliflexus flocculans]
TCFVQLRIAKVNTKTPTTFFSTFQLHSSQIFPEFTTEHTEGTEKDEVPKSQGTDRMDRILEGSTGSRTGEI